MVLPQESHPLSRFVILAAALVFIGWGMVQAQAVLVSCLVSVFLAVLATPPVLWLERKRVPSVLGIALVVLGMVVILVGVGAVVGTSVNSFHEALPEYQVRVQERMKEFKAFLASRNIVPPKDASLWPAGATVASSRGLRTQRGLRANRETVPKCSILRCATWKWYTVPRGLRR